MEEGEVCEGDFLSRVSVYASDGLYVHGVCGGVFYQCIKRWGSEWWEGRENHGHVRWICIDYFAGVQDENHIARAGLYME